MGGTPLVPQQKSAKKNCLDLRLDEPWSTQTSGLQGEDESVRQDVMAWDLG